MGRVPGVYIAGALVPALIITILFYFDHSVSSQLAQASAGLRAVSAGLPVLFSRTGQKQNWQVMLKASVCKVVGSANSSCLHTADRGVQPEEALGVQLRLCAARHHHRGLWADWAAADQRRAPAGVASLSRRLQLSTLARLSCQPSSR